MDSFVQYLVATPRQRPVVSYSDKETFFADDKNELDQLIAVKQRYGWLLLARSYSMEEGHGATLARKALAKAA